MKTTILVAAVAAAVVAVSAAQAAAHPALRGTTIGTAGSSLGRILVDAKGETLYLFAKDGRSRSRCTGACASYWPPLLTKGKPFAKGAAKQSLLGVTRRTDGTTQVTYAGHPLYRFALDSKAGQTKGEGLDDFGGTWFVLASGGAKIASAPAPMPSGNGY